MNATPVPVRTESDGSPADPSFALLDAVAVPLLVLQPGSPKPVVVNDALSAYSGVPIYTLREAGAAALLDAASNGRLQAAVALAATEGRARCEDLVVLRGPHAGSLVAATAVRHDALGAGACIVTLERLQPQVETLQQVLRDQELRTRELLEGSYDVAFVTSEDFTILYVTASIERELGFTPDAFVGSNAITHMHPDDVVRMTARHEEHVADPALHGKQRSELRLRHRDGHWLWFECFGGNRLDVPGIRGVVTHCQNIDARKRAEEALQRARDELQLALGGARLGAWDRDLRTGAVHWKNDEWQRALGIDPEAPGARSLHLRERVHPDELERFATALDACVSGEAPFLDVECRMRTADDGWRWIQVLGQITDRDAAGNPVRLSGVTIDTTARREIAEQVAASEARFRIAAEAASGIVYEWDLVRGTVQRFGKLREVLGPEAAGLRNAPNAWLERVHPDDLPRVNAFLKQTIQGGAAQEVEYRVRRDNGDYAYVWDRGIAKADADGVVRRMYGFTTDVTELKRLERLSLQAQDDAQIGVWELNLRTGERYFSAELYRLLGCDPLKGPPTREESLQPFLPEYRKLILEETARCKAERSTVDLEAQLQTPDGRRRWVRITIRYVYEGDEPVRAYGTTQDIDHMKRAQVLLRQKTDLLRTSLDVSDLTAWVWDVELNQSTVENRGGASGGTFAGIDTLEDFSAMLAPEDRDRVLEAGFRALRTGESVRVEYRARKPDGSMGWFVAAERGILDGRGQPIALVGTTREITPQKLAEQRLAENERRYRLLFHLNPLPMFVYDRETLRFLAVNRTVIDRYGYSEAEFLTMTIKDIRPSEDVGRLLDNLRRLDVTEGIDRAGIWRHRCKDGSVIDVDIASYALEFAGRPAKLVLALDVTARLKAERALRDSELTLRALTSASTDWLALLDDKLCFRFLNKAAWGREPASYVGQSYTEAVPEKYHERVSRILDGVLKTGQPFTFELSTTFSNGRRRWFEARIAPVVAEESIVGLAVNTSETTESREAAEHLRMQALILETMGEGVALIGRDWRIRYTNPAFEKLFGAVPGSLIGRDIWSMNERYPGDVERVTAGYERAREAPVRFEMIGIKDDGGRFIGSGVSTVVRFGGEECFLSVVQDISEREALEREVLEVASREQERIGHDLHDGLGQELTGVSLMLGGLTTRLQRENAAAASDAVEIAELVKRAISSTRQLARGLSPVQVDRGGLVFALRDLAARAATIYGVDIQVQAAGAIDELVDQNTATQLYRIVQEALTNTARHAGAQQVRLEIERTDHTLRIAVIDDGAGLPERLDESGGMGLRIMRYRAQKIGARLDFERHQPQGTVVRLTYAQRPDP